MEYQELSEHDAIELARVVLRESDVKPSYYEEPFEPHEWAVKAIQRAYHWGLNGRAVAESVKPTLNDNYQWLYADLRDQVRALYTAGAHAFTTSESGGGRGFRVVHKFPTLMELQAYYRVWIDLLVAEGERQQEVLRG